MNFNIDLLSKNVLFNNIPKEKIHSIISSSVCNIKTFDSGVNIYETDKEINSTGIILKGAVDIIHMYINGDETIVNRLTEGEFFCNYFSYLPDNNNLNYIRNCTPSTILFINIYNLLQEHNFISEYHSYLFKNIIHSLAKSNIVLNTKICIMSQKTLRDKLITYFELLSIQNGSNEIIIPFNREQLACYLGSERSSVCRELSKLNASNIINIKGNHVVLLH